MFGGERHRGGASSPISSSPGDRDKDKGGMKGERWRVSILTGLKTASRAAKDSSITGVPEVAMLVETLVTLMADNHGNTAVFDTNRRLCSNVVDVLRIVERLSEESATETDRETGRSLVEGVQEELDSVISIIEAFKGKTKLKRFWTASWYRKRVEEAEASVRSMLEYLN
ncbi:unnamed protein product, partial [Ectocarpus fasciculatus]